MESVAVSAPACVWNDDSQGAGPDVGESGVVGGVTVVWAWAVVRGSQSCAEARRMLVGSGEGSGEQGMET
jgi:hypothetical protein